MRDKKLPEKWQLYGKVNYWQSLKWQERFEKVREEIAAADFSAKDEKFRLAQLALLDNEDQFFDLLPHALDSGAINSQELVEWPLFRKIRESSKYIEEYQTELESLAEDNSAPIRDTDDAHNPLEKGTEGSPES